MIRHIVFFSARNPDDIDTIVDTLRTYADIPGVEALEVSRNSRRDELSNEIDVVLHACFRNGEALEAYKRHPLYLSGIEIVRPLRDIRVAADYEIEPASP